MLLACGTVNSYIGLVHWVAVGNAGQPVLGLVLRVHNSSVDKLEESGLRVAVVLAQGLQELVSLSQVKDVERAPGLTSADVEPPLALGEQRQELTEVKFRWNRHPDSVGTIHRRVVDSSLS